MLWHKTIGAGGLVGGGGSPITFTGHNTNSVGQRSSYTWTSFDLGSATSNKYVVVLVVWVNGFSNRSLNSMTIAGVSATVGSIRSGIVQVNYAYGFAPVTATSGDIVCNWSGNTANYSESIDVWQWEEDSSFTLSEGHTASSFNENSPALNTVAGDGVFLISTNNWASYDNADAVTDRDAGNGYASAHV